MKRIFTIILTTFLVALFAVSGAKAQESGDFRSTADGDWSATATWETFNGTAWVAASAAPDGSENITINDGDSVNVASGTVTITGQVTVEGTIAPPLSGGELNADGGTLVFADGSTYEHARDGGSMPEADWQAGSTTLFTGILSNGPDNRDQAFYNITWNNSGQISNVSLGLGTVTIGGNVRVVDTGSNRFRLTDSGSGDGETITINGDVIVEGGAVETTGSGSTAVYNVVVMGDVVVEDGTTLATSRGSGGQATWTLHGDFTANGEAELRDSNDEDMSRFVFAGSSAQTVSISSDVSYNGAINYTVATGSEVVVAAESYFPFEDDFVLEGSLTLNGELVAGDTVNVDGGTLTVADGGTYNHAHDEGEVPEATWSAGSTIKLTGVVTNDPDNLDQDFHNLTWDNEGQIENINIGWDDYTLLGNLTVLNSNGQQFRLSSAGDEGDPARSITIMGNVVVDGENAEFTATGSGDIFDYNVTVMGNIEVLNGGFLSVSRGSGGRAVWTLYGDMTINGGEIGDSDIDKHGQTRSFVFAADTASNGVPGQTITANNVSYDSEVYFEVADSSGVAIVANSDFTYEGVFTNYGVVDVDSEATLTFADEATYNHARDGGDVPTAVWAEGSTAMFTGIVTSGPGNASQDYYNFVVNVPDNIENNDFDMDGNTIHGDVDILSTGSARIYFTKPDSFEDRVITVMGDIYVDAGEDGAFSTQGTGSGESSVTVHHHGDITVDSGNFSIGRGSGPIVSWYLYGGSFTFNAGETQNSNARSESAFIFAGEDTVQHLAVSEAVEIQHLPVLVDSGAYLDLGTSNLGESGDNFTLEATATLASSDSAAFSSAEGGNLELGGSGDNVLTLSSGAHYVINGSEAQWTGFALPLQIASLTIDNEAGVTQSRVITFNEYLKLSAGVFDNTSGFNLGEEATIILDGGSLLIPVDGSGNPIDFPEPPYEIGDTLNYNGSFATAELGATTADGWIIEGTAGSSWEIADDASDDDSRALKFDVSAEGENWYTSQAINEPIVVVEGELYQASAYLKADEAGRLVRFYAGMGDNGGYERARGWETPQLELTTEYVEYTFEFTATAAQAENGMRMAFEYNVDANDGGTIYFDNVTLTKQEPTVSNEPGEDNLPTQFALSQNYPNPFNPTTTINFDVPEAADVTLEVFDVTGRKVAELVNTRKSAGTHSVDWNAQNFATGIYIYRLKAGDFTAVRKLTLIK